MDATLPSIVTTAPITPAAVPQGGPEAAGQSLRGAEFANLFAHLMDPGQRQDLAAVGLQALPIGTQIEVITAAEPVPDPASLAAFARGQGLDESMVRALFGAAPAAAGLTDGALALGTLGAAAMAPLNAQPDVAALNAQPLAAGELGGQQSVALDAAGSVLTASAVLLQGGLGLKAEPIMMPITAADAEGGQSTPDASELNAQHAQALSASAVFPALVGRGPSWTGGPSAGRADGAAALASAMGIAGTAGASAAAPVSALSWQIAPTPLGSSAQAGSAAQAIEGLRGVQVVQEISSAAAGVSVQAVSAEEAGDAMQQALRLRLEPNEFITRRLAAMAGTGEQSTWAAVAGQSVSAGVLKLDLRDLQGSSAAAAAMPAEQFDAPLIDADGPTTGSPHIGHEPARPQNLTNQTAAAPWTSTAGQRMEQYEQLAQRLGEALGQRLQSQLERGQWKVQMRLDPANLGRIELDLDMSAGGLDAVFRSDNQVTRDLIAQGLPRLRESLSQSGTAVANVWVQGDSSRQSGGNPTPERAPDKHEGRSRDNSSDEPVVATAVKPRRGTSAWDVLA